MMNCSWVRRLSSLTIRLCVVLLQHCDGADIEFPFIGRRGLESRDLSVKCCELDLCNYPSVQVASTIPSGSTMQPTSASTMQTRSTFTSTSTTPPAKRSKHFHSRSFLGLQQTGQPTNGYYSRSTYSRRTPCPYSVTVQKCTRMCKMMIIIGLQIMVFHFAYSTHPI